jgi:tetratricopeptide (TPR) repeat protein
MTDPAPMSFLDVQTLLDRSQPRRNHARGLYLVGLFLLVVMVSALISNQGPMAENIVRVLSGLAMLGIMGGLFIYSWFLARAHRAEQIQLEAIEELVTLRRWPQAAIVLENLLSNPTRSPHTRIQALIYLAGVLARYDRFDDAIFVQNYLLDNVNMDESTGHALRLGRAMGMLRQDHLFDADRAIAELRRRVGREQVADEGDSNDPLPQVTESAGLALVEMYRDVKTGHPTEAIEGFSQKLPLLRRQLGHRVADAWALAAKAYDLLGQHPQAQQAFENATILSPMGEMIRRYPELASLTDKYRPATAPAEAA